MDFRSHSNFIVVLLIVTCIGLCLSNANDTITSTKFIRDPDTLSSNNSDFKLGFFSPQNSTNRYVGIWYLSESNVIWVANRNQPLKINSYGIVTISEDGNLVVLNRKNKVVWSSNVTHVTTNSIAKLLDSGNLVLLDGTPGEVMWESFQHPSDVHVPQMKLSTSRVTGDKTTSLTSWKSPSDPSVGYYSATLERPSAPEVYIWVNGTRPCYRSGPWNGGVFIGLPTMPNGYLFGWSVRNEDDGIVYLSYYLENQSYFGMTALTPQGRLRILWWNNKMEKMRLMAHGTYCDHYGMCGAFGSCDLQSSPICSCLSGYEPKNLEEWNRGNWTSGCVRRVPLQCEGKVSNDGFWKLENVKVPDFVERLDSVEDECRTRCLENCSCVAYAYESGIGCMVWSRDLIDMQRFSSGGVDLYIRVAPSELGTLHVGFFTTLN